MWASLDQVLSSASNFVLAVVAARSLSPGTFGAFAIVYSSYLVLAGVNQGATTAPLAVRFSAGGADLRRVIGDVTGACVVLSAVAAQLLLLSGAVMSGEVGRAFLLLGLGLPALLLQDTWRYVYVVDGRPWMAAAIDGIWLGAQTLALVALTLSHKLTLTTVLVTWEAAAAVSLTVALARDRTWPSPRRSGRWLRTHASLALRYAAESLIVRGSAQVALILVAAIAGIGAAGALRGAAVLFGPLNSLYLAGLFVAIPEGARLLQRSRRAFDALWVLTSGVMLALTIVWGVALIAERRILGVALLGATWAGASTVLIPTLLQYMSTATSIGPQIGLKALAAAGESLRCQQAYGVMICIGASGGALIGGTVGAATGIAAASIAAAAFWIYTMMSESGSPPTQRGDVRYWASTSDDRGPTS